MVLVGWSLGFKTSFQVCRKKEAFEEKNAGDDGFHQDNLEWNTFMYLCQSSVPVTGQHCFFQQYKDLKHTSNKMDWNKIIWAECGKSWNSQWGENVFIKPEWTAAVWTWRVKQPTEMCECVCRCVWGWVSGWKGGGRPLVKNHKNCSAAQYYN